MRLTRKRVRCIVGRFGRRGRLRNRRGSVSLQFGLINIPFLIFVLGFAEFAWQATTAFLLDAAAMRVSRFGITGQAAPPGAPPEINCRSLSIPWLVSHTSAGFLRPERVTLTTESFGGISAIGTAGAATPGPGAAGQIVVYTLTYRQPLLSFAWLPATGGATSVTHQAVATVRNEPFTNAVC